MNNLDFKSPEAFTFNQPYVESGIAQMEEMLALEANLGNVAVEATIAPVQPSLKGDKFGAKFSAPVENNSMTAFAPMDISKMSEAKLADLDRKAALIQREKAEAHSLQELNTIQQEDLMRSFLMEEKTDDND